MYDSCRNMASNRTQMNPERGDGPQEMQVLRVPGSLHRVHPMADSEEVTQHRSCAVPVEAHGGYITRQDHAVLGLGKSTKFVDHPASLRRSAPPQRPIHSQAHRPSPKVHFAHRPFRLEVSKQARTVTNGARPHRRGRAPLLNHHERCPPPSRERARLQTTNNGARPHRGDGHGSLTTTNGARPHRGSGHRASEPDQPCEASGTSPSSCFSKV